MKNSVGVKHYLPTPFAIALVGLAAAVVFLQWDYILAGAVPILPYWVLCLTPVFMLASVVARNVVFQSRLGRGREGPINVSIAAVYITILLLIVIVSLDLVLKPGGLIGVFSFLSYWLK